MPTTEREGRKEGGKERNSSPPVAIGRKECEKGRNVRKEGRKVGRKEGRKVPLYIFLLLFYTLFLCFYTSTLRPSILRPFFLFFSLPSIMEVIVNADDFGFSHERDTG
jgi:hypothetical protein